MKNYINSYMKYKISQYAKLKNVTVRTVWNWISSGKVCAEKTQFGWRIIEDSNKMNKYAIYARVSSSENKNNLESQKNRLVNFCAANGYIVEKIICEIGSGLNDTRPKLEKLLTDKTITHIVVEHKDRLARFGLNYIEQLLKLDNREIIYINKHDNEESDLMQDFVSIITSFTARLYGKRRSTRATEKLIKKLQDEKD
jgi:putative resolvase